MKKIISFILSVTICTTIFGEEFKEVSPLEKFENQVIKEEIQVQEEIQPETVTLVEEPKERIEDLGVKRKGQNGIVYAGKETTPYTGKFALFLGDVVEYTETYVNGILSGPKTWYSDNGNIVLEENYKNNKIEGEQKAYYENGNIKSIVNYKNGIIVKITAYAKDGSLLHESDLSKGTGLWKYFWENGNTLEEGSYKNWKKDGKWVKYRENGEIDVTSIYKNGRLIEQIWG